MKPIDISGEIRIAKDGMWLDLCKEEVHLVNSDGRFSIVMSCEFIESLSDYIKQRRVGGDK